MSKECRGCLSPECGDCPYNGESDADYLAMVKAECMRSVSGLRELLTDWEVVG